MKKKMVSLFLNLLVLGWQKYFNELDNLFYIEIVKKEMKGQKKLQ